MFTEMAAKGVSRGGRPRRLGVPSIDRLNARLDALNKGGPDEMVSMLHPHTHKLLHVTRGKARELVANIIESRKARANKEAVSRGNPDRRIREKPGQVVISLDEIQDKIEKMKPEELKRRIKGFRGNFKLDFTDDYLDGLTEARLRHLLLAALTHNTPRPQKNKLK